MSKDKTLFATRVLHTMKNMYKSLGIHVKIENLKSDKRPSWMCLEDDLGFFFGCILMSGAYSDEKPLET